MKENLVKLIKIGFPMLPFCASYIDIETLKVAYYHVMVVKQ